jgi:hypothetical protein
MAKVTVDQEQKLVEVDLTGFINVEQAIRVSNELKKTYFQSGPQQAALLIDLVGFAPMSNDVPPILRGMGRDAISFFRKAALVQEFAVTLQGRKIVEPPPGYKLPSFPNREEAMRYLME